MPDDNRNTTDRLRHDIDRGGAGDKVPFMDPAAAPLGTDDEAAGTPPTPEQIAMARASEARIASATQNAPARADTVGELAGNRERRFHPLFWVLVVVALVVIGAIVA